MKTPKTLLLILGTVLACQCIQAETIRLTLYDDGLSCPGDCDAHVVFHKTLNGTEFAHAPETPAAPFSKCETGSVCRICIESGGKQCLQVRYRGGGPAPKTFDFTPAFYDEVCAATPAQPALDAKCGELKRAAAGLEGRINCIAEPEDSACKDKMRDAEDRYAKDRLEYDRCIADGEVAYNRERTPAEQRSLNCAYEKVATGGPNSRGTRWRKLLPGACRTGTFVGRDGLDCCSGHTLADGPLGIECRAFYPLRPADER